MDKQTILDHLIAAQPTADLVLIHNYLPQGSSHVVGQLNQIHKQLYGRSVMLHCSSCVVDMFKRLYNHTKPNLINELTIKENVIRKTKSNRKP